MSLISTNVSCVNKHKSNISQALTSFVYKCLLVLTFLFVGVSNIQAQTSILINPATEGGFNSGTTFTDNGWTVSNSANNPWVVGTGIGTSTGTISGSAAYVSSNNGVSATYVPANNATNYFYRDITVPSGKTNIQLKFDWISNGEASYDLWQVFIAPTSITPVGVAAHPGSGTTNVPAGIAGATFLGFGQSQTTAQNAFIQIPATYAGTTFRLIFSWKNEVGGTDPPAIIDNISLTAAPPQMFTAITSGPFTTASTWNKNAVPGQLDSIKIESGLTVTADASASTVAYAEIGGTLTYATTATSFNTTGDFKVNTTGFVNVFNGTTGKTLNIAGNLINNGSIDLSKTGATLVLNRVATTTSNTNANAITLGSTSVTLAVANPLIVVGQYVSGNGIAPLTTVSAISGTTLTLSQAANQTQTAATTLSFGSVQEANGTGSFVTGVIQNLTFNNTAPYNLINWNLSNSVIGTTLTFTKGRVALGSSNSMTVGTTSTSTGTLTISSLTEGFTSGKFIKWYTGTVTGTAFTAATLPSVTGDTRMPFVTLTGDSRHAYWTRAASPTPTTGKLSCVYSDATTLSNTSVADETIITTQATPSTANSITSGSTTVTLGAANALIAVGQTVKGTGIASGTTVSAISGTTLTLSQAATASSTSTAVTLSFSSPYSVGKKFDGNWTFAVEAASTTFSATSINLLLYGYNAFNIINGNARIINGSGIIGTTSTHQAGTVSPTLTARRLSIPSVSDLTASPVTLALASADVPVTSVTSGDWNTAATWSNNVVPTCTDAVIINPNHNITSSTTGNLAANITISAAASLTLSAGDLTVGCGTNNMFVNNNGKLIVTGGTLKINGNLNNIAGSTINQSGGNIIVDGNGGTISNSVATGTPLVWFQAGGGAFSQITNTSGTVAGSPNVTLAAVNPNIQVGQTVNATSYFPAGTTVVSVNGTALTLSQGAIGTNAFGCTLSFWPTNLINLTGGNLIIVDGHIGTATLDRALTYSGSGLPNPNVTTNHTIQFGNGTSTDLASTNGFAISLGSRFAFGNMIVNTTSMYPYATQATSSAGVTSGSTAITLSATNTSILVGQGVSGPGIAPGTTVSAISTTALTLSQAATATFAGAQTLSFLTPAFVSSSTAGTVIMGDLTVTNGEYRTASGITSYVGGNIVNNGILTTIGTLNMGEVTYLNLGTPTVTQNTASRSIGGTGLFRNLLPLTTALPTANFTNLTIQNSNVNGVSLATAASLLSGSNTGTVSGTLVLNGNINTNGGTLALGTAGASTVAAPVPTVPTVGTLTITSGGVTLGGKMRRYVTPTTLTTTSTNLFALVSGTNIRNVAMSVSGTGTQVAGWIEAGHADTAGFVTTNNIEAGFVDSAAVTTAGSKSVTLYVADPRILVGQTISGPGIAAGTLVAAISSTTLTLSQAATATTAVNVPLTFAAFTNDVRSRSNWTIATGGGYSPGTYKLNVGLNSTGLFQSTALSKTSPRAIQLAGAVGVHAIPTGSGANPVANRAYLTLAELTAAPFYLGGGSADIPWISVASGDWNSAATWNKNSVPACTNSVIINQGHTVTVNSAGNFAKEIVVNSTGTLVNASGSLQIGCTYNNNFMINNGTYTMNGGTLKINGSMLHNANSIFNQTAGDIIIDGNDSGFVDRSVPTAVNILQFNSEKVYLSGGKITITDPHAAAGATDYALIANISPTGSTVLNNVRLGLNHTIQFGDSLSTNPGGTAKGFNVETNYGTRSLAFGKLVLNTAPGLNRNGLNINNSSYASVSILSDLVVKKGNLKIINGPYKVAGNIINNDTISAVGSLTLSRFAYGVDSAVSNPQSISGTGIFRNLDNPTTFTASLTNLAINNNNATGVTLNVPISVSGTLTLTSGIVNTSNTNLLRLGTATLAGTLSIPATLTALTYVNGPFARTFAASRSAAGNSSATLFPVGKGGSYIPMYLDPTTASTGAVIMKSEAFNTNAGTPGPGVIASTLSTTHWETSVLDGLTNFTSTHVGLTGLTSMVASNKILQSATGAGAYGAIIPSTTFTAGVAPAFNTLTTSGSQILAADYLGNFAYADLTVCTTPTTQPSTLTFSQKGANSVRGTFTASTGASNYLVVAYPKDSSITQPVDFKTYSANAILGKGKVVAALTHPVNTFYMSGLTAATTYKLYIYAYNNTACYGPAYNITNPLYDTVRTATTPTTAPNTLAATAITNTGYTLTWEADSISTFELDLSTASDFSTYVTGYNAKALPISTRSETITGLNGSTIYYARIRAINAGVYSNQSSSLLTITDCNALPASVLPWTEGFENQTLYTYNKFPSCWKSTASGTNQTTAWYLTTSNPNSGTKAIRSNYNTNSWAFTPRFALTAGVAYDFSFFVRAYYGYMNLPLGVYVGKQANAASMTDTLATINSVTNLVMQQKKYIFVPDTTGEYSFGINTANQTAGTNTYDYYSFDDFKVNVTPLLTYDSAKVVTAPITSVTPSTTNAVVAKLRVYVSGNAPTQPLNATSITVGTTGTTNINDISNLKVYYSGNSSNFNNSAIQFGSTIAVPTANNIVTGTTSLSNGDNYFWVTYDVKSTATVNNYIDATIRSITTNAVARTPVDTAAVGNRLIEAPMTFISSTVKQVNTSSVEQNAKKEEILRVEVVTSATGGAIKFNGLDIGTIGTTSLTDIKNIKLYYTGNSATFATTTQVGSTVSTVGSTNTITDDVFLTNNTNYFWLTYDIDSLATLGNVVDAEVPNITIDGIVRTPSTTAPNGARTIRAAYCKSYATSTADDDIGNVTISRNGVDVLNNGVATPVLSNSTSIGTYTDFTKTVAPVQLLKSGVYNFSISQINSTTSYYATGRAIYIDYNDDGDFLDPNEKVFSTTATISPAGTPSTGQFTVPCDAVSGFARMRVVMIESTGAPASCGSYVYGETEDYTVQLIPSKRAFVSSNTSQDTTLISAGSVNEKIVGIPVVTSGCGDSLIVSSFSFGIGQTTAASDILTAKLYYTNSINRFSTDSLFGSTSVTGNTFTITGLKRMATDTSWFWLAYDVKPTAAVNNKIDASVTNHTINGVVSSPSVQSPSGFRVIAPPATYISSTAYSQKTSDIYQGTKRNVILRGVIRMSGGSPVELNSMDFNTTGSTSANVDVDSAEVWFSSDSTTFSQTLTNRYGSAYLNPNGSFTVSGSKLLKTGANYFWLTYSIPTTATINNLLDAEFTSSNIANSVKIPTLSAPAGSRTIKAPYCSNSYATNTNDEDIGGVVFSTIATGTDFTTLNNALSVNAYTDYTYLPAAPVQKRVPTPITVYIINSSAYSYTTSVNVFIDYNHNSVFDLPGERVAQNVLTTVAAGGTRNFTANINIPITAMLGETRMRIVANETSTALLAPCGTYSWGETEDYVVNILPPPPGDWYNPVFTSVTSTPNGNACNAVPHLITANITDSSGIYPPTIRYAVNGVKQSPIGMSRTGATTFVGTIPTYVNQSIAYDIYATDSSANQNFDSSAVFTYIDQYLSVYAGEDEIGTIGSGTKLTAYSNLLNSMRITEVNLYGFYGTGSQTVYPPYLNTPTLKDDNVEITNMGSVPMNLSGFTLQTVGANANTLVFPAGTIVMPDSVAVIRMASGTPNPLYNYFTTAGSGPSSGSSMGVILKDPSGVIIDAIALNNYIFPSSTGVTSADWSGPGISSPSGYAGPSLSGSDNNSATNWQSSATLTTSMGYKNTGLVSVATPTVTWTGSQLGAPMTGAQIMTPNYTSFGTYTYVASLSDGTCTVTDTVKVTAITPYVINLGANTAICPGSAITLDAGVLTDATYLWSTGATTQTINVSTAGTYSVTATSALYGKTATDTIVVTMGSFPIKPFGADTTFCRNGLFVCDALNPGSTYLWSNGATTQTINATLAGTYSVRITSAAGCVTMDTMILSYKTAPVVNLGADVSICPGSSATLDAGNPGLTYLWSTGATTQTIVATTAGQYIVTVFGTNGCSSNDTLTVSLKAVPVVNLGVDQNICTSDTITLNAANPGATYLWSTGETTQTIRVNLANTYSVAVTNAGGCSANDAVVITNKAVPNSTFTTQVVDTAKGQQVKFTAVAAAGTSYAWNFGDPTSPANTSSLASPTHLFSAQGTYTVTLTVTNVATGCKSVTQTQVTVTGFANDFAKVFNLFAAPNPFAGNTKINYELPSNANVTLEVYDMIGRKVSTIANSAYQESGVHTYDFSAGDNQNASGVYMVRLIVDGQVAILRVIDIANR